MGCNLNFLFAELPVYKQNLQSRYNWAQLLTL